MATIKRQTDTFMLIQNRFILTSVSGTFLEHSGTFLKFFKPERSTSGTFRRQVERSESLKNKAFEVNVPLLERSL